MVKWPPTGGWKGHFESPGTYFIYWLVLHRSIRHHKNSYIPSSGFQKTKPSFATIAGSGGTQIIYNHIKSEYSTILDISRLPLRKWIWSHQPSMHHQQPPGPLAHSGGLQIFQIAPCHPKKKHIILVTICIFVAFWLPWFSPRSPCTCWSSDIARPLGWRHVVAL